MPSFDVDARPVYIFEIAHEYLFKQYFEERDLFQKLNDWYNSEEYRFEVPPEDIEDVVEMLQEYYYAPKYVDELDEFCVVKEQYTEHTDILRNSVANWQRQGYNFFLMKDPGAVEQAVTHGATPIKDTDLTTGL